MRINKTIYKIPPATEIFSDIIKAESVDGWKFCSMKSIPTQKSQGSLIDKSITTMQHILIFRKEQDN